MTSDYRTIVVTDETKRLVEGFANVAVLDRQGDIIPSDSMAKAMLDYMNRGAVILLSHENKPVGKVLQWNVEKVDGSTAEGIHIIASIDSGTGIADAAWKMLKDKTLTGFSIGGIAKRTEEVKDKVAANGVARKLVEIELNEISLVQIPANQLATVDSVSVAKASELMQYANSKPEAELLAQKLKQEGNVVFRIYEDECRASNHYCVCYGPALNREHEKELTEKAEESEGEKLGPDPNGNYDQSKYGIASQKMAKVIETAKAEMDKILVEVSKNEIEKPVQSRAQWGWLAVHRPDLLHDWQGEAPVKYRELPEHAKFLYGHEENNSDELKGRCAFCGNSGEEDKYGFVACENCAKKMMSKAGSKEWRCPHCGSMTETPRESAPDKHDYRWCPGCMQHRRIGNTDEAHKGQRNPGEEENVGITGEGVGGGLQMAVSEKGIYSGDDMVTSMSSPVEAAKSDTKIKPWKEEEKKVPLTEEPVEVAVVSPKSAEHEDECAEEEKAVPPQFKHDEEDEKDKGLVAIGKSLGRIETLLEVLVQKANYTTSPASPGAGSEYPKPKEDGPLSDGLAGPRINQMHNPESKPFGKQAETITKVALGGASDGSKEVPTMGNERGEYLEQILKGKTKLSSIPRSVRGA